MMRASEVGSSRTESVRRLLFVLFVIAAAVAVVGAAAGREDGQFVGAVRVAAVVAIGALIAQEVLRRRLPDSAEDVPVSPSRGLSDPEISELEIRAERAIRRRTLWLVPLMLCVFVIAIVVAQGDADDVAYVSIVLLASTLVIVAVLVLDGRRSNPRSRALLDLAHGLPRDERKLVMRAIHSGTPSSDEERRSIEWSVAERRLVNGGRAMRTNVVWTAVPLVQVVMTASDGLRALAAGLAVLGAGLVFSERRTQRHARRYLHRAAALSRRDETEANCEN